MTPFAARKKQKKNNLGPIRLGRVTLFGVGFWGFLVLFPLVLFCFFLDQQSEALAATCAQFTWICRETQPGPTQASRKKQKDIYLLENWTKKCIVTRENTMWGAWGRHKNGNAAFLITITLLPSVNILLFLAVGKSHSLFSSLKELGKASLSLLSLAGGHRFSLPLLECQTSARGKPSV